jgi:Flp pilus assembly protein TadG
MTKATMKIVSKMHRANDRRIKWRRNDSGQVLIALVIMLPILFGILGLGIDVAAFYSIKRFTQTAADAGAKAGAAELQKGSSHSLIVAAAQKDVTSNGYTNAASDAIVTVSHPPVSGPHTADSNFVEVVVTKTQASFFMRVLLGSQSAALKSRAVGGLVPKETASIVVLDPSASGAFAVAGGAHVVIAAGGGIVVDSNNAAAMTTVGAGTSVTAGSIGVTGGYTGSGYTPTPQTGVTPLNDPLASIQPPSVAASCDHTNFQVQNGTFTLNPGVYCGGINIKNNSIVTFASGTYILKGGGLQISGNGTQVTGTGVAFYSTYDASHSYDNMRLASGASATLTAPTSGSLREILFFQDRTAPAGSTNDFTGGNAVNFTGAIYFPTQKVRYRGGAGGSGTSLTFIVGLLDLSGNTTITLNDFANLGGSPVLEPKLVE